MFMILDEPVLGHCILETSMADYHVVHRNCASYVSWNTIDQMGQGQGAYVHIVYSQLNCIP